VEKNSIFEVNGNAYDALSGAFLGHAPRVELTTKVQMMPVQPAVRQTQASSQNISSGNSMDGVVTAARQTPSYHKAHNPQPTKTLMRQAVQQPYPGHFRPAQPAPAALPPNNAALQPAAPTAAPTPKLASASVSPVRAHRARIANRSHAVEHFRPAAPRPIATPTAVPIQTTASMPVQVSTPAPQPMQVPVQQFTQLRPATPQQVTVLTKPIPKPAQQQVTVIPQPLQPSTRALSASRRPYNGPQQATTKPAVQPNRTEQDLFSQALAQAKSHEQPAPKLSLRESAKSAQRKGSRGRKLMAISASFAIFVALCGVVAFQNRSQIELQMASAKAGFAVASPMYLPQGYKNVKLQSASGNAAAAYQSDTQQRFTIVQKKSNWNSETLLDNFVIASNEDYRGFQSNGRTVYVYGKGNATWVNGGIWYQIKGATSLSDQQLVKIAASM